MTPLPLFFTPSKSVAPHLRTWAELRKHIKAGAYGTIWTKIEKQAIQDLKEPLLTPSSMSPGRQPDQAKHANRDFSISVAVCQRILRTALLFKITGDKAYKDACLQQIDTVCNPDIWVEWRDKSHVNIGIPADLRTGWISRDVGLAYNWLRSSLTTKQRQKIIAGIDQMGIRPYLDSLPMNPSWLHQLSNWTTCIVGGMGICGMALGDDHPDSAKMIEVSKDTMGSYFDIFGSEGEFNESPGYAGSIMLVVKFYSALQCVEPSPVNRLAEFPFPQAARWIQYLALGPKRLACFGDGHPEAPPFIAHYSAVAAATGDPVIQGLAQHYCASDQGYTAPDVYHLLWLDPTTPAQRPGSDYPRHVTFKAHGACFSSRSDWKISGPDCVVYGKAGREPYHSHPDAGQVCLDAHGERLIRDLGLPSGGYTNGNYHKYYNASVLGHNLLTINDQELAEKATKGRFLRKGLLPDGLGVHWICDLTAFHPKASKITRSVFHLLPNVVIVIDDAHAKTRSDFRLRWHTAKPIKFKENGSFKFVQGKAILVGRVKSYSRANVTHESGRHTYRTPYDCNRLGEKHAQRREPYVDILTKGKHCCLLTVFATGPSASPMGSWKEGDGTLRFTDKHRGTFAVSIKKDVLHYQTPKGSGSFTLPL